MAGMLDWFKVIIIVQLFYASAMTLVVYAVPEDSLSQVEPFTAPSDAISLENVSNQFQDSIEDQTNIPIVELGSLVFYSGNILLDLLLNFAFAIPQMVGLLLHGFTMLINVDDVIWQTVQLFASVAIGALYIIGLFQLLMKVRSGQVA